jgi:hypothetical protein
MKDAGAADRTVTLERRPPVTVWPIAELLAVESGDWFVGLFETTIAPVPTALAEGGTITITANGWVWVDAAAGDGKPGRVVVTDMIMGFVPTAGAPLAVAALPVTTLNVTPPLVVEPVTLTRAGTRLLALGVPNPVTIS